jgi:hypothetical protein
LAVDLRAVVFLAAFLAVFLAATRAT